MGIFVELADNGPSGCSPVVGIYAQKRGHLGALGTGSLA